MTIQQLARRAGVTPRTIRYYVEQGLLPPPGRGRPAEYGEEHVQRLELIRRLKDQYLPLEEIRDTLQRLTVDQVEDLLASQEPPRPQAQPRSSAADYISHVLGRGAVREQMKTQAMPAMPAQAPVPPPAPAAAPMPAAAPAAAPARAAFRASPIPADEESVRFRLAESAAPAPEAEDASTWQRVALAPGVELHYQVGADAHTQHLVARLIEAARRILGAIPGK